MYVFNPKKKRSSHFALAGVWDSLMGKNEQGDRNPLQQTFPSVRDIVAKQLLCDVSLYNSGPR